MKQTYSGSCHCGAIRFEAVIDLAPAGQRSTPERSGIWWETTFRCNCSYCAKTRYWKAFVPLADFRWVAGRDASANYQFGEREIEHYFCTRCGVHPFAHSTHQLLGGEFYCVNVACLDGVDDSTLASAPLAYENGRQDEWGRAPAHTKHL